MASYWERRKDMKYYRRTLEMARRHAPKAQSLLDVGCQDAKYIEWFDWVPEKWTIDWNDRPEIQGVSKMVGDFMSHGFGRTFDLVLCLQVLEHVPDPPEFCRRLLSVAKTLVVSVPYKWEKGKAEGHIQDPVDEEKLAGWMGRVPDETVLVRDRRKRLVSVYGGGGP